MRDSQHRRFEIRVFLACFAMFLTGSTLRADLILFDDFIKDPVANVTVDVSGRIASFTEDSTIGLSLMSLDPGLGDPDLISPLISPTKNLLKFDFDFQEGVGETDEFFFTLFDATSNSLLSVGTFNDSTSGTVAINMDQFSTTTVFGMDFQLTSRDVPPNLGSTLIVSDLRVVPEPSPLLLGTLVCGLVVGYRRRNSLGNRILSLFKKK